jgi:hypothetical protein
MSHWPAWVGMIVLFGAGCGVAGDDDEAEDDTSGDDDSIDWLPDQEDGITSCGSGEDGYCANEVIDWTYDTVTGGLWMRDSRVPSNCCTVLTMRVAVPNPEELYVLEGDELMEGGCGCECLYDLAVTASGVPDTVTTLTVERWVSNYSPCSGTVWAGPIDLTAGAGSIVVEDLICGDNERIAEQCEQGGYGS